jgi:hypothetical protein
MSTGLEALIGGFPQEDPRKIEFVRSLLTTTKAGKVSWVKKGNAYTALIPNGVTVNFVLSTALFGMNPSWELFTVRDRAGNELIDVNSPGLISVISKTAVGPLLEATNQLFAVVSGATGDALDQAIESLKKL